MKGKRIKQINNLVIYYTEVYQYSVWTKNGVWGQNGKCLEDRLTLQQAIDFCKQTKDFLSR